MSGISIAWTIIGAIFALAVGIGIGVLSMTPPEFTIARICFAIAALALGGMAVFWSIHSNEPTWWRVTASILVGAMVFVLFPEGWRWVNRREAATSRATITLPPSTASEFASEVARHLPTQTVGATDASDATVHRASDELAHTPFQPRTTKLSLNVTPDQHHMHRVAATTAQPRVKWSSRQVASLHPDVTPYAIEATLLTVLPISSPHVDVICDGPIEHASLSVEPVDPTMGGPAMMSSDRHNTPNTYQFDVSMPAFTPDLRFKVLLDSKQPIRIKDITVSELAPRTLSQTMVNSPGGIQAGGNISITSHNKPARHFSTAQEDAFLAVLKQGPSGEVEIQCDVRDRETSNFGGEINRLLKKAGWKTKTTNVMVFPASSGDDVPELDVVVHDADSAPPYAAYLATAFKDAGFYCPGHWFTDEASKPPKGSFILRVLPQKDD